MVVSVNSFDASSPDRDYLQQHCYLLSGVVLRIASRAIITDPPRVTDEVRAGVAESRSLCAATFAHLELYRDHDVLSRSHVTRAQRRPVHPAIALPPAPAKLLTFQTVRVLRHELSVLERMGRQFVGYVWVVFAQEFVTMRSTPVLATGTVATVVEWHRTRTSIPRTSHTTSCWLS